MENQSEPHLSATKYWTLTVASVWFQCSVGASRTFDIYSTAALKSGHLGYHQTTLSVFNDIGANTGVVAGLLYAVYTHGKRRRISVVMAAAAVLCFIGYLFIWAAAVDGVMSRPSVPVMCLFVFLAGTGQTFFSVVNAVCGVPSFSGYGGIIAGMLKIVAVTRIQQFILGRAFS